MSKTIKKIFKNKTILFLALVVFIVVLILLGILIGKSIISSKSSYYAVYLDTGDLYFGELSRFPRFEMKNAWYIQNTGQQNGGISINEFSKVFWGPSGTLRINNDKVVWVVKIKEDSQLMPLLKGQNIPSANMQGNSSELDMQQNNQNNENAAK